MKSSQSVESSDYFFAIYSQMYILFQVFYYANSIIINIQILLVEIRQYDVIEWILIYNRYEKGKSYEKG